MGTFPQKLKFDKVPRGSFIFYDDCIKLRLINKLQSSKELKELVYKKVKATWNDFPATTDGVSQEEIDKVFMDVLTFKTLPNSMESIVFDFELRDVPLVEITHLLRHRTLSGIHAQCTGDRDLRDDNFYIPNSIVNSPYFEVYMKLHIDMQNLYSTMVDSKEISIMDARYCLPRSSTYFYYFSINLKDAIMFINQRKCTMIQPELDNKLAHEIHKAISSVIPEFAKAVSLECNKSCHYINSSDDKNTRLYQPDEVHAKLFKELNKPVPESMYDKTRIDLGGH